MLTSLDQHAAGLSHILRSIEISPDWYHVCDWLNVAAAVRSVRYDSGKHNIEYSYCSSADEFVDAREVLLQRFVENNLIFSFVWGALEASLNIIRPPKHTDHSKRGKIRDACYYLNRGFCTRASIFGLRDEIFHFRAAAEKCLRKNIIESRFAEAGELGEAGVGLYSVYELRNQFAHGSLAFPMPDCQNRPISPHDEMVTHATRITLLQFQMLCLTHFGKSEELIDYSWHPGALNSEVPLWLALRTCHLKLADTYYQGSLLQDE